MSLIEPLPADALDNDAQAIVAHYERSFGYVTNNTLKLGRLPKVLISSIALVGAVMEIHENSRVTLELKTLLMHLVSGAAGCRYCQAHTGLSASKRGVDSERLAQIWEFRTSPLFTDAERAALELAVGAGVTPNAVTPAMHEAARRHWNDDELAEILSAIALMGWANRWNDTDATPLEGPPHAFASKNLKDHGWTPGRHSSE